MYKFQVWMRSMQFRYLMESIICGVLTFVFQYYITGFNKDLHKSRKEALIVINYIKKGKPIEKIEKHRERLHEELIIASEELQEAMFISMVNLLFPVRILMTKYFLNKTKRNASIIGVLTIIELSLFILEIMWLIDV